MFSVLLTDAWINRNKRSDLTIFVNKAAALPVGNLQYLILTNQVNSFLCDSSNKKMQFVIF